MAATKNDDLFGKIADLLDQIVLNEGKHTLSDVESMELLRIQQELFQLWNNYLERLIEEAVQTPENVQTMKKAGASPEDVAAAEERVRARLAGEPKPTVKTVHQKAQVFKAGDLSDKVLAALPKEVRAVILARKAAAKKPKFLH